MGTPTAQRVREHFERRQNDGLVQIRVWVPRERAGEVRTLASRLVTEARLELERRRREAADAKQAAWEAAHPPKQKTRQQVIEAMACDVDADSVDEFVTDMGSALDEAIAQFAKRKRIKVVG